MECSLILVTGASGFIGRHLCLTLARAGYSVRAAIRDMRSDAFDDDIELVTIGNIGPDTNWEKVLEGVDCVIHLAARVHILKDNAPDPLFEFLQVNLHGTMSLVRQSLGSGVKKFIYLSSIGVNGPCTVNAAFRPDDIPSPVDPYSMSKYQAEKYLLEVARGNDIDIVVLRPPLVYGSGCPGNFNRLMRIVDRGLPLPLASINNVRHMISLVNLCDLLAHIIISRKSAGQVFLASDGVGLSTPGLIRRIAFYMGKPARLFPVPPSILKIAGALTGQSATISRLCDSLEIDMSKTVEYLSWSPPQFPDDGIRDAVEQYLLTNHA